VIRSIDLCIVLLSVGVSGLSWAQTQPENVPQNAATQATAIHQASKYKDWEGSITAGTQISRGATNVNGINVQGSAHYSDPSKRSVRLDWTVAFAEAKVPDSTKRVVVQDRQTFLTMFSQPLKGRYSYLSQLSFEHDRLKGLSYRATALNGLGIDVARGKRFKLTVAPGIGLTREHKNYVENEWLLRPGFYEGVSFALNERWMFNQSMLCRINTLDKSDSAIDGASQLSGMINKRFGVQFTYTYNYEGKVAPGFFRSLSQLTAGITVKI
jgi:putative salt-induced outer membrane protein YdiY